VFRKLTEQKIPKLKDKNRKKECYYGEKKRHTVKIQYIINKKKLYCINQVLVRKEHIMDYTFYKNEHQISN